MTKKRNRIESYEEALKKLNDFRFGNEKILDMRFKYGKYMHLKKHEKDGVVVIDLDSSECVKDDVRYMDCILACDSILLRLHMNGFLRD